MLQALIVGRLQVYRMANEPSIMIETAHPLGVTMDDSQKRWPAGCIKAVVSMGSDRSREIVVVTYPISGAN